MDQFIIIHQNGLCNAAVHTMEQQNTLTKAMRKFGEGQTSNRSWWIDEILNKASVQGVALYSVHTDTLAVIYWQRTCVYY